MATLSVHNSPAFRAALLFAVGILLGDRLQPHVPLSAALALIVFVAALSLFLLSRRWPGVTGPLAISLALLCVTVGASKISLDRHSSLSLPDSLLNIEVVLVGTIIEPAQTLMARTRCVISGEWVQSDSHFIPIHANLLVSFHRGLADRNQPNLDYGMVVAMKGRVSRPLDQRNPGEFSSRKYYEANGISLLFFLNGATRIVVVDTSAGSWWMRSLMAPARRYMLTLIDTTIGGEEGEFLKGLLLGERGGISPLTREAFTNSGVAHILAVSGSNVAVVATVLFFFFDFLRLPKPARIIAMSIGLLCYMILSENQPPVVRATIMALVFLLGRMLQEKQNVFNALGISALIILGIDARQLFDVGFQLSFMAVLSIVYLYPKVNTWISEIPDRTALQKGAIWLLRVCAVSAVATLGTLPLTAVYFGRVSVIGIASNIVVIPAAGISVVLGFISIAAGVFSHWLAEVYAEVNHLLLTAMLHVASVAGGLSFAYFETVRFTPVDALPFYSGLAFVAHVRSRAVARRFLILFLIALNIAVFYPMPPAYATHTGKLRASFIDVGQGDALLVEFPDGRNMLIDAGPSSQRYDTGRRTVVPFLKRRGISTVDLLVVTHPDNDHMGGAHAVFDQLDVRRVVDCGQPTGSTTYQQYLLDVKEEHCPYESVRAGRMFTDFAGARLYVVSPHGSYSGIDTSHRPEFLNNSSVVIKLQYGSVSFLLTGDAEMDAEREMASSYGDFLRSNVLKVGHHGGITGSSEEFLNLVKPVDAVISVGRNNRFHHPSLMITRRLQQLNAQVWRTDEQGAIIIETDGISLSRVDWR